VSVAREAVEADATGFLVLQRGADRRRIPYWLRVERPALGAPSTTLARTGTYAGNTRGKRSRVTSYRYPDDPKGLGISNDLSGPEQVFRVRLQRNAANFGVTVLSMGTGVVVTPRVVAEQDENRLTGDPALPVVLNPYLSTFGRLEPVAGAILPPAGTYDVVFDTRSAARAGPFRFRFWINDTTPPAARLLTRSVRRGGTLEVALSDAGSGVDPASLAARLDGTQLQVSYAQATGRATLRLPARIGPGSHRLELQVSDYQEAKNMEDVAGILPNSRTLRAAVRVR
jgi:hypothetical protein